MKMHSRNALRFPTSFRNRFSEISARFSRSPDLKNRALAYTRTRFSKNRRFRFRTSFWRDFWWFYLRFLPPKSIKTPPKTVSRKLRFSIAFFARFSWFLDPLWDPFSHPKSPKNTSRAAFGTLQGLRGRLWSPKTTPGSIFDWFWHTLPALFLKNEVLTRRVCVTARSLTHTLHVITSLFRKSAGRVCQNQAQNRFWTDFWWFYLRFRPLKLPA